MVKETFTRDVLRSYFEENQEEFGTAGIEDQVALSFMAALRKGKRLTPKAPLKKVLEHYLRRELALHLDKLDKPISEEVQDFIYTATVSDVDGLRKYTKVYAKLHKPEPVNKEFQKMAKQVEEDPSVTAIFLDIANSFQNGMDMFSLNSLITAPTPERLYRHINDELVSHKRPPLSKQRGTYAFISTDQDGHHERYAGVARVQNPSVNKKAGYVTGEPNIGGRNAFELYKMIHNDKGQFFEKRFGQFKRVKKISVMPMVQLSDETFQNLVDIQSYDEYMKVMESLTMGFVAGFGIQNDGSAGLNIKHADDPEAFLAGLSIGYPATYHDLKLLENNIILKSWSDEHILNLFGLSKLYKTDEELGTRRDPTRPETFRKTKGELALARIRAAKGFKVLDDHDSEIRDIVEAGTEWNNVLDRVMKIQDRLDPANRSITHYNNTHEIGELTHHDLVEIQNRADRIAEAVSIFSDFPAIDMTWALSNLDTRVKYEKIDLTGQPVQDKAHGESDGDFRERVKMYEDAVNGEDATELEEIDDQFEQSR